MTLNQHEILDIKRYVESLGTVRYKLGEEMRPALDGGAGPFQYALSEQDLADLYQQDWIYRETPADVIQSNRLLAEAACSGSTSMPMGN